MDTIKVQVPGHYKPKKVMPRNRTCQDCSAVLSIYNSEKKCSACQKERFVVN